MSLYFRPEKAVLGDVIPLLRQWCFLNRFIFAITVRTGMNSIRTAG